MEYASIEKFKIEILSCYTTFKFISKADNMEADYDNMNYQNLTLSS